MPLTGPADGTANALAFLVGGEGYSVPAERVIEVIRTPPITRVPLAPPAIAGVINFHGAAIPALRVATLLGKAIGGAVASRTIVYADPEPVALLVDYTLSLGDVAGARRLDIAALVASHLGDAGGRAAQLRRAVLAEPSGQGATAERTRTLLSFHVADQHYALPLGEVREVIGLPEAIATTPGHDAGLLGMATLRDAVMPIVSLAHLLGLAGKGVAGRQYVVVTSIGSSTIGLVTGPVDKVLRLPETLIEPIPELLQRGEGTAEIEAVGRLDGGKVLVSILSPAKLLGNAVITEALAGRRDEGRAEMAERAVETATEQFVVLVLGEERFGLPIAAVDEIVQLPDAVTRVPRAPVFLTGVINLRGTPLPIIDQRQRFATGSAAGARPRVVVLTVDGLQAGFIVDGVSEIVRVPMDEIGAAPSLAGEQARTFDRVAPIGTDGGMLLLIDPRELLDRAERDLIRHLDVAEAPAGS